MSRHFPSGVTCHEPEINGHEERKGGREMFEVGIHAYGRKRITRGPMQGCLNFAEHKWTIITRRPLGLKRAIELADAQPYHAVVTKWRSAEKVHDNQKPPELPEGWYPAHKTHVDL